MFNSKRDSHINPTTTEAQEHHRGGRRKELTWQTTGGSAANYSLLDVSQLSQSEHTEGGVTRTSCLLLQNINTYKQQRLVLVEEKKI